MALLEETVQRFAGTGTKVRFKYNGCACIGVIHGVDESSMLFSGTIGGTPTQPRYHIPLGQIDDFFEDAA